MAGGRALAQHSRKYTEKRNYATGLRSVTTQESANDSRDMSDSGAQHMLADMMGQKIRIRRGKWMPGCRQHRQRSRR